MKGKKLTPEELVAKVGEKYLVRRGMTIYGGEFVRCLGESLVFADSHNTKKIRETWPNEWATYLDLAYSFYEKTGNI